MLRRYNGGTEGVAARSILLKWGAAVLRPYLGGPAARWA